MDAETDGTISFPSRSGEAIVLELNAYPEAQEVLDVLFDEEVPLSHWPDVVLGYYRLGRLDEFVFLLEQAEKLKVDNQSARDQMRLTDMLAAYYVHKAKTLHNEKERKECFSKATMLYTTADKVMMYDADHLIGRAYFCLIEAVKWDQAKVQFDYIINLRQNDTSAIIGRALVNYASGDYDGALAFFKRALRQKPNLPAEVRLGFGHCYLKLKEYDKAIHAFNRVLQMDNSNLPARVALATCLFHNGDPIAKKVLKTALEFDPENPVILNQLANIYFLEEDGDKEEAAKLAWRAYECSHQAYMKAEPCYLFARCAHAKGDFEEAFKYYTFAVQFGSANFVLPYYGLGQIHLYRHEYDQAVECFEKVLAQHPEDVETLKILGCIYSRWQGAVINDKMRDNVKKGEELLQKVLDVHPDDVEVLLALAQAQEGFKPADAIQKYEKALALLESRDDYDIPAEMYSNMGSLHYVLGNYNKSKSCYDKALEITTNGPQSRETEAKIITIQYNLARLYDAICWYDEAEELYMTVLEKQHDFVDALLRLGAIFKERGDSNRAIQRFKDAAAVDPDNPVPWVMMANVYMDDGEIKSAQSSYEHVMKLKDQKDSPYALIGIGNCSLEGLFSLRMSDKKDKDRITKYRDHAMNCFLKVIKKHPHNAWAANGVGCLLAHKGHFQDARDLFSQVREAAPEMVDASINLAHIHMELKQYAVALQMYKNVMQRHKRQYDSQLLMYAARASWKAGKFSDCRNFLERASIESPANLMVSYGLAVVTEVMATQVLKEAKASLTELRGAVSDLRAAERTFMFLSKQSEEQVARYRYISRTVCASEAGCCKDLLRQADQYYTSALKKDTEERQKQEAVKAARLEQIRQREAAEREERERLQRMEDELKRQRMACVEKTKEILRVTQVIEEKEKEKEKEKKRGGGGGRRKKDKDGDEFVNDSSDMGEWEGAGNEKKKKKKEKRQKRKREHGGASGSEGENKAPKKKRKSKKSVEEEEAPRKGKIKSRAYVSSSDSSDSDAEPSAAKPAASPKDDDVPPAMSDDSDLSDSSKDDDKSAEPEKPRPKRTRIDDSDEGDSGAEEPEEDQVAAAPARPSSSADSDKPPPPSSSDDDDSD